MRKAIAVGLRFVERGLLELPRFVEPALNAPELLEGTAATARNGQRDDNGADDHSDDGADDPAEERKVANESADDAARDGNAAEPSGPAASFDKERGELLVLEIEDALLEIVQCRRQTLFGAGGLVCQFGFSGSRRWIGSPIVLGGGLELAAHRQERVGVALEAFGDAAAGLKTLCRFVEQLLRLVLVRLIDGVRLPLRFFRMMLGGGEGGGASVVVGFDRDLERRVSLADGVVVSGGGRLLRSGKFVLQRAGQQRVLFVQTLGRCFEFFLGVRELRADCGGQDPLVAGAFVGQLLQVLHQFEFATGGEAGIQ